MRILAGSRVVGLDQCPGFDCPKDALPDHLADLFCQLNEAERRGQVLAEVNAMARPVKDLRSELRSP